MVTPGLLPGKLHITMDTAGSATVVRNETAHGRVSNERSSFIA
jgi:hypothetical protein